jgi:IS30 family transposase
MGTSYNHLSAAERTTLMVMLAEGLPPSTVARHLGRSRSTISRELGRNRSGAGDIQEPYDAIVADDRARSLRAAPGLNPKLGVDTPLFGVVQDQLREGWSPEQIAGRLEEAFPDDSTRTVSHETIYTAIYVLPRGSLRTDLISLLRHGHAKRRPRARGQDRRGQIADMVSLHMRPPEIEDRVIPGHWEGDLIKGARNQSCVGTLVRMDGATAEAALEGFTAILNRVRKPLRKTLTYDQGKEMSRHKDLTAATGVAVYFADPHSPWQRGSNENANGLIRQYLPKGTDLSRLTQDDLDAIAYKLNTRPRKILGFRMPLEVYAQRMVELSSA